MIQNDLNMNYSVNVLSAFVLTFGNRRLIISGQASPQTVGILLVCFLHAALCNQWTDSNLMLRRFFNEL